MATFEIGDIVVITGGEYMYQTGKIYCTCKDIGCPWYRHYIDIGNGGCIYNVYDTQICKISIDYIEKYGIDLKNSKGFYKTYTEIIEELKEKEIMPSRNSFYAGFGLPFYLTSAGVSSFRVDPTPTLKYPATPPIIDVNPIVPDKVVEVTFADGTKEKAVCKEPDVFSMDAAISVCVAKKAMGGSSAYNKAVKQGLKVYNDKLAQEVAAKEEQKRLEKKREKREAYKARRFMRRKAKEILKEQDEKEKQIEIQKEAYIRAMEYMKTKYGEANVTMPGDQTEATSKR